MGADYLLIPPYRSFAVASPALAYSMVFYATFAVFLAILTDSHRRILMRLEAAGIELQKSRDELEQRVTERTAELEHAQKSLRNLSGRMLRLQDDERRRIARELHDSSGQTLVAIDMNLSAIQREAGNLGESAAKTCAETADLVQQLSKELRTLSYLLHPPLLDEVGLPGAIRWLADGFAARSKIEVTVDCPRDVGRLSTELETAVFRIVQESLTNVHRHSRSRVVSILVTRQDHDLLVEVTDKGTGISDVEQKILDGKTIGVGIAGMRERAFQLGGTLQVQSSSQGTLVRAVLPIVHSAIVQDAS
jgi:signal transduction histidine kinase